MIDERKKVYIVGFLVGLSVGVVITTYIFVKLLIGIK